MVTALYRRYRPENFAELIGQSQVTDPLRTALRTNRVNHAYLFSGPRGCGKTTSARILARCLNCEQGPTDTPCGVCPSCVELARGGGGSLDVIEIDAASHNGVDDARDLRDRAVFAPARDRYKIFILDEAHMVTPQGFNALLKLVEEPPEHVKFIFATTEPEKVIGTIRSRTHHYPFRLVPPATMLEYVEQLCEQESVSVAPGVLPLVVRAGGGSVRDTLSLLDQLMAGSEDGAIAYERAVALLGYTDAALLDDVVDALAVADPASAFAAVDRVVQTGQDPRRFVEDLLERLRDLIVVAATNESAAAVLRGVSPEELDTMTRQAGVFGATALSRSADIANRALTEMTGATSPRLHLELMTARMLVPEADDTQRGALARVERLERRVGVGDAGGHDAATTAAPSVSATDRSAPTTRSQASTPTAARAPQAGPVAAPVGSSARSGSAGSVPSAPQSNASAGAPSEVAPAGAAQDQAASAVTEDPRAAARAAAASWAAAVPSTAESVPSTGADGVTEQRPAAPTPHEASGTVNGSSTGQGTAVGDEPVVRPVSAVGFQQLRDAWPQVVEHVQRARRSAWSVVVTAQVTALRDDVLTLTFPSQQDVASFKEVSDPSTSVSELLRSAIIDVLGLRVKFVARGPGQQRPGGGPGGDGAPQQPGGRPQQSAPQQEPARTPEQQDAASSTAQGRQPEPAGQPGAATWQSPTAQQQPTTPGAARQSQPERQPSEPQQPERQQLPAPQHPEQQRSGSQQPAPQQAQQQQPQQSAREQSPAPQPTRQQPSQQQIAPASTGPVTDWVVAAIPATDPTSRAAPGRTEPGWSAPFGTTDTGEPVVPVAPVSDPAADAALAAQLRPASALGGAPARPTTSEQPAGDAADGAPTVPAGAAAPAPAPTSRSTPPAVGDVPVDDYPLDDDPYDDGAPFPDPGPSAGGTAAASAPGRAVNPSRTAAPEQTQHATAQQGAAQQAAAQQAPQDQQRTAPPQVRRTPVAGRYGEAVVREILGAQFIEETALHEEGA